MTADNSNSVLWTPSENVISEANVTAYMHWLSEHEGVYFDNYHDLWQWTVANIEAFWSSIWRYFQITASADPTLILSSEKLPGAKWFTGSRLNYAENFFSRANWDLPAMVYRDETGSHREVSWEEVQTRTAALASTFRSMGVKPGDRVAAYLPNIPETVIALFATASLGAIWSSCSPDFGS